MEHNIHLDYADEFTSSIYNKIKTLITKNDTDLEINEDGRAWVQGQDGEWRDYGNIVTDEEIVALAAVLATRLDTVINMRHPSLDAEIPYDGARINITIPPVVSHPTLSLRIHRENYRDLQTLRNLNMFDDEQMLFMKTAVKSKRNIVISGETGSGKTTLLTALINEIPPSERLIVIEDTREISTRLPNVSFMLVGSVFSGEEAVKTAMRKNPSRIIYGEVRDRSALDLIKAWNTAHKGGMGTIHANSASAVRTRFISLCGEASASSQERAIDEALDIIIQIEVIDGKRKITEIKELSKP